ncbi:MAG: hypothetical protein Q8O10_06255 [candidate division Zixibacteria bacterium]|nr:hypothetical protein [candidate division Zixibacteria bacterium]
MFKLNFIILFLFTFLISGIAYSEQGKVRIILENGYYYTQLENGSKFAIVKQNVKADNKWALSPDEQYVAYTISNHLGSKNEGQDVFCCKLDGDEKIFLHRFEFGIDTLLWDSMGGRDFIFVTSRDCDSVGTGVIDLKSKEIILTFPGNVLKKVDDLGCYHIYCNNTLVQQGRQEICLQDLTTISEPVGPKMSPFTRWAADDIYVTPQGESVLKLGDLPKLAENLNKQFADFSKNTYFYVSRVTPAPQKDRIFFIGQGEKYFSFFGVFDVESRKLLLLDCCKGAIYPDAMWSPTGSRLALLRRGFFNQYIDFYEFNDENKPILLKMFNLGQLTVVGISGWSEDSTKLYVLYIDVIDNKKKEKTIELFK